MIQATPQLEPAQPDYLHIQKYEAELAQDAQPDNNEPSAFAKILAGISNQETSDKAEKNGTEEHAGKAADSSTDLSGKVLPAENADYAMGIDVRELITNAQDGANREAGEFEPEALVPEYVQPLLSQQEKNILSAVDRLVEQSEDGQPKNYANENLVSGVKTSADSSRQAANTDTRQNYVNNGVSGQNGTEKQAADAVARSGTIQTESSSSPSEKARSNAAEIPAESKQAMRYTAGNTAAAPAAGAEALNQTQFRKNAIGERDGRSRLEETRNRRRTSFESRDSRNSGVQVETMREGLFQMKASAETRIHGDRVMTDGTTREITLELRLPNQGQDAPSAQTTWEVRSGQAFENMLARELHQNFNNDIVRHASVLLREANEGIIRLALKPESLGNVKIHLEMSDNKIVGHIIVESEEALRAFEREISSLEQAFRDSGYEGAELEMSLAADGREAQQQWQAMEANRNLPWHYAASRYDTAAEQMELPLTLDIYRQGTTAVNMLA